MLTTGEVAKLFQVSAQTVINWLEEGRMPFERIGKGPRRLTEAAVLDYVARIGLSPQTLDQELYEGLLRQAGREVGTTLPAVAVLDREARVIAWNDGAVSMFGYSAREMVNEPIDKLWTQVEGKNAGLEYAIRAPWQGSLLEIKARHRDQAGKTLRSEIVVSRLLGKGGDRAGFVLLFGPAEQLG